jgi:hypothetical protein
MSEMRNSSELVISDKICIRALIQKCWKITEMVQNLSNLDIPLVHS